MRILWVWTLFLSSAATTTTQSFSFGIALPSRVPCRSSRNGRALVSLQAQTKCATSLCQPLRSSFSPRRCWWQPSVFVLGTMILADSACLAPMEASASSGSTFVSPTVETPLGQTKGQEGPPYQWIFPNGRVTLSEVTRFGEDLELINPTLLGSGAGGAVFAMQQKGAASLTAPSPRDLVGLKVSWNKSADSVRNECQILQRIAHQSQAQIGRDSRLYRPSSPPGNPSLELCLGMEPYYLQDGVIALREGSLDQSEVSPLQSKKKKQQQHQRVMIALQPVFTDSQANSLSELAPDQLQVAVSGLMQSMVQLLSLGIVTTDVHVLISKSTGRVLLIDFTEARVIATSGSDGGDTGGRLLAANFVSEIMSLIPPSVHSTLASDALLMYLDAYPPPPGWLTAYTHELLSSLDLSDRALAKVDQRLPILPARQPNV